MGKVTREIGGHVGAVVPQNREATVSRGLKWSDGSKTAGDLIT